MIDTNQSDERDNDATERALGLGLRHKSLSAESLNRISVAVEAQWLREVQARRLLRTRQWIVACAASLAAIALMGRGMPWARHASEFVGALQSSSAQGLVVQRAWGADQPLAIGAVLKSDLSVRADATSVVLLDGGGLLRLRAGSVVRTGVHHELMLERGAIYLDLDAGAPHGRWTVRTRYGTVQHLGTQFEVAVDEAALRVRVREGYVQVLGRTNADAHGGEEVVMGPTGGVRRGAIATYDPSWAWVEDPPSHFDADGRSVLALLQWVAREMGRKLDFTNERTRHLAERTILHGSVHGLSADQALRAMLATTTLSADIQPGRIWVRSTLATADALAR